MPNLSAPTLENVDYMIDVIKTKLRMASGGAMRGEHFDLQQYEDIKDIYELIISKDQFSISEVEAIVSELGSLRKA